MMSLGGALREAEEQRSEPARHQLVLSPEALDEARGVPGEKLVHDFVFERYGRLIAARIALPPAAAEKLAVDAPCVVPLGREHVQAADLGNFGAETDVGATAGHVRGDGDAAALTCLGDHLGLDRKSTRLNSSHLVISYAVFCLKKKKRIYVLDRLIRRFKSTRSTT